MLALASCKPALGLAGVEGDAACGEHILRREARQEGAVAARSHHLAVLGVPLLLQVLRLHGVSSCMRRRAVVPVVGR
eukprot:scaffold6501_cov323-Prasinococcus_capsulatus_cf.AAC.5